MTKEMLFEDAMRRLEEISDLMNHPATSLDTSLALYEEASSLMTFCENRIQQVEKRIKELSSPKEASPEDDNLAIR